MNILSFVLAIAAIVVFALTSQGHRYGSLGFGLALLSSAWVLQLIWVTDATISL